MQRWVRPNQSVLINVWQPIPALDKCRLVVTNSQGDTWEVPNAHMRATGSFTEIRVPAEIVTEQNLPLVAKVLVSNSVVEITTLRSVSAPRTETVPVAEPGSKGPDGDQGLPGNPGDKGETGDKGQTGDKGVTGDRGPDGLQGVRGPTGEKGLTGDKGATGDKGPDGEPGIKGAPGDQGFIGDKGPTGDKGPVGNKGPDGDRGPTGFSGDKGPVGDKGITGDKGLTGDKGVAGDKGTTGDKGPVGDTGSGSNMQVYVQSVLKSADTIAATVTETTFASKATIAANSLAVGDLIRVTGYGTFTTTGLGPMQRPRVRFGSAALIDVGFLGLLGGYSNLRYQFECTFSVRAIGTSGKLDCIGRLSFTSAEDGSVRAYLAGPTPGGSEAANPVTVNTTIANELGLSTQYSAATAGNSNTLRQLEVRILKATGATS